MSATDAEKVPSATLFEWIARYTYVRPCVVCRVRVCARACVFRRARVCAGSTDGTLGQFSVIPTKTLCFVGQTIRRRDACTNETITVNEIRRDGNSTEQPRHSSTATLNGILLRTKAVPERQWLADVSLKKASSFEMPSTAVSSGRCVITVPPFKSLYDPWSSLGSLIDEENPSVLSNVRPEDIQKSTDILQLNNAWQLLFAHTFIKNKNNFFMRRMYDEKKVYDV